MIEDKNRTVAELLETAKAKLRSLIQYLCALDATQSKDGVFFASNAMEGSSHKVCAVLSMRNEILECELPQNYAWDLTPWEELMGYGLAETWIDSHPYLNLSAELEEYFDFSAYGGDLQDEYNGKFVSNGFVYMEGSMRLEDILEEAQDMDLE